MSRAKLEQIGKGRSRTWMIVNLPGGFPDHGPYDDREEALADKQGLCRMYESRKSYWDKRNGKDLRSSGVSAPPQQMQLPAVSNLSPAFEPSPALQ